MTVFKTTILITLILLGVCLFFFGGYDDSPGAQGLGLLIVISGVYGLSRSLRKKDNK